MEIEAVFGGASTNTVGNFFLEHTKNSSDRGNLSCVYRFQSLEFYVYVSLEHKLWILIDLRLLVNRLQIKLFKLSMCLFHAVKGVVRDVSV